MDNKQIADIFSRIADMLEIKDENVFKVRAYRTAALNILGLGRQLADVYKEDPSKIEDIPGIGKDLKLKITEMIETGKLKYYDELIREFPRGFLDMLNLAGLGPRKLRKLKDELGIGDVDDLEKACKAGKVAKLEGMGDKTQEKLLEAIEHFRKKEGRMLLVEADLYSRKILEYLKGSKVFKKIERAGSLRRGSETVGDIDILAVASDAGRAMDHFAAYPGTENVIAKGATKSSITIKEGPQVDLRVIDPAEWGAALVYFTGSKLHNVKIRHIAKDKGLKVSEYGVFSVNASTGAEKKIAGKTEEDVYRALGMEWIPPELREDRGEVELALRKDLPELVEMGDIKGDLHLHTTETDGRASVEEIIKASKKRGYKYIAITDHSKNVKVANGMDEKRLLEHAERIRKYASRIKGMDVLVGVEVDILEDGKLDLKDAVLKELDIVIISVHSKFTLEKDKQTRRMLKAMDNPYANVLAHPSGRLITTRSPIQMDFDAVFRKAAERGIFLEINTHGERIDLNDVNSRRAKELGAKFVINSDAHDLAQLDQLAYGVITARRGWLEKDDVLNTYPLAKMRKALKK